MLPSSGRAAFRGRQLADRRRRRRQHLCLEDRRCEGGGDGVAGRLRLRLGAVVGRALRGDLDRSLWQGGNCK